MHFTGYVPNPAATDAFLNLMAKIGREPDGKRIADNNFTDDKKDIVLYPYLFKALPNWKSGRQGIGDCVSWMEAQSVDVLAGVQAFLLKLPEIVYHPCCTETAYGFMRVEVFGRPDYGGDGAYGSAAAKAVVQFGTLHRTKYDIGKGYDFTKYSGSRAKEFGRTGVPDDLEPLAREHIVRDVTLVKDFETAAKFIMNGYPIANAHGSNPTLTSSRDKDGYGRGVGKAHAMNYIGVRWGARPALLKSNTGWTGTVTGPMWPNDIPATLNNCCWWEEADLCNKVLKGADSFAYANYKGFPQQALPDWGAESFL